MKSKKQSIRIRADLQVSFWSYPTKEQNQKAKRAIFRWIKCAIDENIQFIDLYNIEPGCEDCTQQIKSKVKYVGKRI